ncbi:MAG: antA/AntB antirepressor family protein [Candidatus Aegiribacteria sp.]|nr:antA/AntB antirepressor family protein [Candidatus Aegiribacteria sp.]
MMNNNDIKALFPIEEQGKKRLVDARMLHQFLEVGTHFREWIRRRIKNLSQELTSTSKYTTY